MSVLINALDASQATPIQIGENGHSEYGWSTDVQEKIAQFDFQCVRTNSDGITSLANILDGILSDLSATRSNLVDESARINLLNILYKLIGKTRDINGGKGEYNISYMMIWTWHKYFPALALVALELFVLDPHAVNALNKSQEPYGSWKDMKYFCKYVLDNGGDMNRSIIQFCIRITNENIRNDNNTYYSDNTKHLSLVSKWVPRESSNKFGFLYDALATNYFPEYMASAKSETSKASALKKCRSQYRILCATLNRHLDTVQIKQSANNWAAIDHSKTTSITMAKQRRAFMNLTTGNQNEQRSDKEDRIQCAENLRVYIESLKRDGKEVKGKHVGLETFTKQAMMTMHSIDEAAILNSQWRDNSNIKNAEGLGPMIAIVDTSGSMSGDPMNAAIALGCRVAEKSVLGKRVMTFSANPSWINLDKCDTFTEMVKEIRKYDTLAGINTNFYKALDMILSVIEESRIAPEVVENIILAIFSDMQIDDNLSVMNGDSYGPSQLQKESARLNWDTLFTKINIKYAEVGMRLYGVPLKPPHILFWNLRQTDGFPCLSKEANCSMMSGYDPAILNMFCEVGMAALKDYSPYKMLLKQLDNSRYDPLDVAFAQSMQIV